MHFLFKLNKYEIIPDREIFLNKTICAMLIGNNFKVSIVHPFINWNEPKQLSKMNKSFCDYRLNSAKTRDVFYCTYLHEVSCLPLKVKQMPQE
jgi:hypothetical protein